MRALVWEGPRSMVMREQPEPVPAPGEVLVRVAYAGICGSELGGYLGHNSLRVPPMVMGHEFAGEIVGLTPDAREDFPDLREGQTVTVNPLQHCGTCEWCAAGTPQLCSTRALLGAHRPGAFAEYVAFPADLAVPLPESVSPRVGALAEPVAVAVHIAAVAGAVAGRAVLVMGAGPIGLLALQTLSARGAGPVFVADLDRERLEMARELGGTTIDPRSSGVVEAVRGASAERGVEVAVDAVGATATRRQCITATRTGGTVILSGLHEEASELPAGEIIRREITIKGAFAYSHDEFRQAVGLLTRGEIRLDPWIVEAPLEEGGRWFDRLVDAPGGVAKVLLVPPTRSE